MTQTPGEFAQSVIDTVHDIWRRNKSEYPCGYAVFYGPIRVRPELMLIGLNPGGDHTSFSGQKESIVAADEPMEYIKYRTCKKYPLAGKTVALFEAIGFSDTLQHSLKTNVNFFRSKKWTHLSQTHSSMCLELVRDMIKTFRPKAILCESIRVFDQIRQVLVVGNRSPMVRNEKRNQCGRRIYTSVRTVMAGESAILIGITHLTGSRPSSADLEVIKQLLAEDLGGTRAGDDSLPA
jgi:hypothetical protein